MSTATQKVEKPLDQKEVLAIKAADLHEAVAAEPTRKGSLRTFLQKILEIISFISPDPGVRQGVKDAFAAISDNDADFNAMEANLVDERREGLHDPLHDPRLHGNKEAAPGTGIAGHPHLTSTERQQEDPQVGQHSGAPATQDTPHSHHRKGDRAEKVE